MEHKTSDVATIDGDCIEFTWNVESELFTTFLNAGPGEGFESGDFQFCGGIWKLKCYPNGTKKYGQGNVSLFLAVMKLPIGVIQLGVQYEFECREVNYKDEYGSELTNIFNKKHSSWGYPETFKRNLLINLEKKNLTKLTIKCRMKRVLSVTIITMPIISGSSSSQEQQQQKQSPKANSIDNNKYFSDNEIISDKEKINKCSHNITWHIDPEMISLFTKSSTKQSFDSTSFQLYRTKWCLQCYPNGDKYANTGMVSLYLKLLEFPDSNSYHIRNIKVRMQFECPDIQYQSNEFLHQYENKKQEVYFGISSAFNTFQLNYLSQNQGIAIKCRIDLVSVSIDGEKWWHCIRERDSLKSKAKRIEYEQKEQNKKLQSSYYICNKVITIKEIQPKIREKIHKLNEESSNLLKKHQTILKQWDKTTNLLKNIIENNCNDINKSFKQQFDDNDDDKKIEGKKEQSPSHNNQENEGKETNQQQQQDEEHILLNEFNKCQNIIDQQQNRLEQVSKNVYNLLTKQTNFLQSINDWKQTQLNGKNEYTKLLKKYNEIKFERIKLQQILQEKVNECNSKIDDENSLNRKKCNKDNELNSINLEIKVFEQMSKECKILIERYNDFVEINNENIEKLNKSITRKWNNFERNWYQWTEKDIIAFIKYKLNTNYLYLDLNEIEGNMKQQEINGMMLKTMDKNDLYSIGFTNYKLRCQIFEFIRTLRTKYPAPIISNGTATRKEKQIDVMEQNGNGIGPGNNNNGDNKDDDDSKIPSKYLCPITKNLMISPVMAFDGYTYEKSAIEQYLKKYKKSPQTQQEAHTLCLFPNLQIQQEIQTFKIVNNDIIIKLEKKLQQQQNDDNDDEETEFIE